MYKMKSFLMFGCPVCSETRFAVITTKDQIKRQAHRIVRYIEEGYKLQLYRGNPFSDTTEVYDAGLCDCIKENRG